MRSAEHLVPMPGRGARCAAGTLALLALAALSACGSIDRLRGAMPGSAPSVAVPTPAPTKAAVPTPTPASPGSAPTAKAPAAVAVAVSTAPIAPATQRAFDDALAALRAGRTADAERGFRALAQSEPELAGPHANLGLIARQGGRLPEAVGELEKATQLDPQQPVMWNQLGIAYRQQGQFAKARAAYDSALGLDADYATAVLNLGVLNDLYLGDSSRALELYARYLALTPAGDATVTKWVADLKNRKPAAAAGAASAPTAPKEKS